MILPIVAYGDPVLRKMGESISKDYPGLKELIANMFDTMYNAKGVGLAAPQIGKAIRLFVIDTVPFSDDDDLSEEETKFLSTFKRVFINAEKISEEGDEWEFNEGCLSIPKIREDVYRPEYVKLKYFDEDFNEHVEEFSGMAARVIQHEYDHIDGKLFIDHLGALKKRLLQSKLNDIIKGKVKVDYKMRFPK